MNTVEIKEINNAKQLKAAIDAAKIVLHGAQSIDRNDYFNQIKVEIYFGDYPQDDKGETIWWRDFEVVSVGRKYVVVKCYNKEEYKLTIPSKTRITATKK